MTVEMDGTEYIPLAEAAAELSTTEMKILMLLKRKSLEGMMTDDGWLVSKASVQCFDRQAMVQELLKMQCSASCSSAGCGCH